LLEEGFMAMKKSRSRDARQALPVDKVSVVVANDGKTRWRVSSRGKTRQIKTSESSAKILDETTRTFSTALARLSDR
jgi:hypothetical protein